MLALVASACGRLHFEPRGDAAEFLDGAPTTLCDWTAGPKLGPIVRRDDLSSTRDELDPYLVPGDPLTISFISNRAGTPYSTYVARRPSLEAPFERPARIEGLDDTSGFNVVSGGLRGHVSMNNDLFEVSRATPTSPVVIGRALTELNAPDPDFDPVPSADELTLSWASGAELDIYFATRADVSAPWGNIVPFSLNVAGVGDSGAHFTRDRLVMVWQSGGDTYYATRPSPSVTFTDRVPLVVTAAVEFEPTLREDGCELFFVQGPAGADRDIYSIAIAP